MCKLGLRPRNSFSGNTQRGFSFRCTSRRNLPHMKRHPMQLYSSKSPQQPTEPQETLYLCSLSNKCLCRFLTVGGFSFLPLSFLVWLSMVHISLILDFNLFVAQKCLQNQTLPIYIFQVLYADSLSFYQTV